MKQNKTEIDEVEPSIYVINKEDITPQSDTLGNYNQLEIYHVLTGKRFVVNYVDKEDKYRFIDILINRMKVEEDNKCFF